MDNTLEQIIDSMTGNYADDLNKISDAIERAMDKGEQELVLALIEYGRSRMEEHENESSEEKNLNYRSQSYEWGLNKETLPLYYEQMQKAMALIQENKIEESADALATVRQWLLSKEELDKNLHLHSFQSIFDEAIYRKFLWQEQDQLLPAEEQMFYSLYGSLLFELDKFTEAQEMLESSVQLNPVESMSHLLLSHLEGMRGDMDASKNYNRQALEYGYIAEDIAEGLINEGRFAQALQKPSIAYRFYELALDYDPANSNVHWCIESLYNDVVEVSRASDNEFESYVQSEGIRLKPRREIIELLDEMMFRFEKEKNWEMAMTTCGFLEALPLSGTVNYHQKLHDYMDQLEDSEDK